MEANVSVNKRVSPSGWTKASLSMDASEEHDDYSSAEDPLASDQEDDDGKKLVSHLNLPSSPKQRSTFCQVKGRVGD